MVHIIQAKAPRVGVLPKVSIVIPCYNYARFLTAAATSALSQEGVDVNVVIVDDASHDDSVEVAERLAEKDSRVRVVRHVHNRGHVETSNEALSYATGTYVVKLDADDLLAPGALVRSAALMDHRPDVVFCYGYPQEFRGDPPVNTPGSVRNWSVWPGEEWIAKVLRRGHNVIMQPEVLVRRKALVATGGYRTDLRWAEDYNLWLRLATKGTVGRINGPTQGFYRVHDGSLQRSVEDIELTDLRARINAVELFLNECANRLLAPDRTRKLAFSSLAREARMQAAKFARQSRATCEAYEEIAGRLDNLAGGTSIWSLSADRTILGEVYRDLVWRLRWRRWRRYGM